VWDDARTVILSVVLLFVCMSVNFDKPILLNYADPQDQPAHLRLIDPRTVLLTGLAFCVLLSEAMLRWMRIGLPWRFRLPYHLFLVLFFAYPAVMDLTLNRLGGIDSALGVKVTMASVLLFPTLAAGITLTLLPAVWAGPQLVADNGTPWKWPLFPWSLFVMLGTAVVLRASYLAISYHPHAGTLNGFGMYFLTPFLIACCVLLFEIGRSVDRRLVQNIALAAPLVLLPLTLPGHHYSKP
jgi:hypothetical protein